jgi:hypothetical protein
MAKEEPKAAKGKKKGKGKFIFLMLLACLAMPFMLPTILLVLAGFAPTYVAFWTDDDPEKSGATCVSAMNIAGLSPFVIDLWLKGQTTGNAVHMLTDPNTWFVILGASAVGQLVAYAVPQAVATLSLTNADSRIKGLRRNLELLKESWGQEVATVKTDKK